MTDLEGMPTDDLRDGLVVSLLSIVWTIFSSTFSVVLGASSKSLVLLAFGATGLLDAAGSVALVVHFRHALRHEAFSERHERVALRIVTLGLLSVGLLTTIASIYRFVSGSAASEPRAGIVVAALSVGILALLANRKRRIAISIPSRGLLGDSWLSATGCLIAIFAVLGTVLTSAFGWWWADPASAELIACGAIGIGLVIARERTDESPTE